MRKISASYFFTITELRPYECDPLNGFSMKIFFIIISSFLGSALLETFKVLSMDTAKLYLPHHMYSRIMLLYRLYVFSFVCLPLYLSSVIEGRGISPLISCFRYASSISQNRSFSLLVHSGSGTSQQR